MSSKNLGECALNFISKRFPSWRSTTKGAEMEILANVRFSELLFAISLTKKNLSLQQLKNKRQVSFIPLRPAIAYSLIHLANIQPGTNEKKRETNVSHQQYSRGYRHRSHEWRRNDTGIGKANPTFCEISCRGQSLDRDRSVVVLIHSKIHAESPAM